MWVPERIKAFGKQGFLFTVLIFLILGTFFMILNSYSLDIRAFVTAQEEVTPESIEALKSFDRKRIFAFITVSVLAFLAIYFHFKNANKIVQELTILRRVLRKSPTTNMIINTHSFTIPAILDLAEAYNQYAQEGMQEYKNLTRLKTQLEEDQRSLTIARVFNQKMLSEIPIYLYVIVRDGDGFSIIDRTSLVTKLFKEDIKDFQESYLFSTKGKDLSKSLNKKVIKEKTSITNLETFSVCEKECTFKTTRVPIPDDQNIVNAILVLMEPIDES